MGQYHRTEAVSYTHLDLGMIQASKAGFLFRSTDKIKADYPDIPAYETYEELLSAIDVYKRQMQVHLLDGLRDLNSRREEA